MAQRPTVQCRGQLSCALVHHEPYATSRSNRHSYKLAKVRCHVILTSPTRSTTMTTNAPLTATCNCGAITITTPAPTRVVICRALLPPHLLNSQLTPSRLSRLPPVHRSNVRLGSRTTLTHADIAHRCAYYVPVADKEAAITGTPSAYKKEGDAGRWMMRYWCGACGS